MKMIIFDEIEILLIFGIREIGKINFKKVCNAKRASARSTGWIVWGICNCKFKKHVFDLSNKQVNVFWQFRRIALYRPKAFCWIIYVRTGNNAQNKRVFSESTNFPRHSNPKSYTSMETYSSALSYKITK